MRSDTGYFSVVHYYNFIGVHNGGYTLSNNDFGRVLKTGAELLSDFRFSCGIYGACRVVEYQYLRLFEKRSCNTKPLLLSAGYVYAALFKLCFIAVGKAAYKGIRLCAFCRFYDFFVACVLITPSKVILDCSREQYVLLQNHSHAVTQLFEIIVPDVHAIDKNFTLVGIIQSRNH